MIYNEGPAHKRTYIMGVEDPNLSSKYNDRKVKEMISNGDFKDICISYGKGTSKKEGEQAAAKMALILHGVLNNDQYKLEDVYYPDWDELNNDNDTPTVSESTTPTVNNNEELSEESESDYE